MDKLSRNLEVFDIVFNGAKKIQTIAESYFPKKRIFLKRYDRKPGSKKRKKYGVALMAFAALNAAFQVQTTLSQSLPKYKQ